MYASYMQYFEGGTWLQSEEAAYPDGHQTRCGRALWPDGKIRRVWGGIPDTFFSIPAHGRAYQHYYGGWLGVDDNGVLYFHPRVSKGEGMSTRLDEIENPFVKARWEEVIQHSIMVADAEFSNTDPGLLLLHLDEKDAEQWGIYPILGITSGGKIAEQMVNQPYYYPTFSMLMTAANARTSVT